VEEGTVRRTGFALAILLIIASAISSAQRINEQPPPNQLSPRERAMGWRLLFDGATIQGWHTLGRDRVSGWEAREGALVLLARTGGEANDLATDATYENFELNLDWKVTPGATAAIAFRVVEPDAQTPDAAGPEYRIADDASQTDPRRRSGANDGLHAPSQAASRPVGQWNKTHIVVKGASVEHWLNGMKVVAYDLWTPAWQGLVQAGRWKAVPRYGTARSGRIVLRDQGGEIAFRSIEIRPM
jgi:hypothetical protein